MSKFDIPRLFIGSSKEGLILATSLLQKLDKSVYSTVWPDAFPLSNYNIESLLSQLHDSDFTAFILSPDDVADIRGKQYLIARDNLIYEAGLSTGIHGKGRCFLMIPESVHDFHLPTDLLGLTVAFYDKNELDYSKAVTSASQKIYDAIRKSIWSTLRIEVTEDHIRDNREQTTYKSKLKFFFTNDENYPITIELNRCSLHDDLKIDDQDKTYGKKNYYQPTFLVKQIKEEGKDIDIYERKYDFAPHERKTGWIPFDPMIKDDKIKYLLSTNSACKLNFQCTIKKENHSTSISKTILI